MTDITILKNMEEEFDLRVPDEFVVNDGHAAKIKDTINFSVSGAIVRFRLRSSMNIALGETFTTGEPTLTKSGATYTYTTLTSDCSIKSGISTSFQNTGHYLGMGSADGDGHAWKTWIPFYLSDIAQGTTIISATLKLTAHTTQNGKTKVKIGCDGVIGTWALPTDYPALNSRVMSSAYTTATIWDYVLDAEYTYNVTTAVQEMITRSDWQTDKGRYLAVLIFNNYSALDTDKSFFSYNNGSKRPTLTVVV